MRRKEREATILANAILTHHRSDRKHGEIANPFSRLGVIYDKARKNHKRRFRGTISMERGVIEEPRN